jgi:AraC-like DNA-binding protein
MYDFLGVQRSTGYIREVVMSGMQMTEHAASFRFSTDGIPLGRRPGALVRLRDRGLFPIEPLPEHDVHLDIVKWTGSDIHILFGTLGGVRQHCQSCHAAGEILLGIGLQGRTAVLHGEDELTISRGDAFAVAASRRPFTVVRPVATQFVGIRIPEPLLMARIADVRTGIKLLHRAAATKLLTAYVRMFLRREVTAAGQTQRLFAKHLLDLVALALGPTRHALETAEHRSLPVVRLEVIKSDILANLQDEALDVPTLAVRHQITPRYLHRLFEREGLTYSQFVLRKRLDRAHGLLCNPQWAHQTISTIAYEVGFGDLSYFNRTFHRQYRETPTDVRAASTRGSRM